MSIEFKTNQGKTFTSNFDKASIDFIMKCRLVSGSGTNRKMIPFPFTTDEIQEIENIFHDELKNEPTLLQHIRDYHKYSITKKENPETEYPDELDENIEEIKDMFNSYLILNWELCEELFGNTGEDIILEDGSVSAETMGVFEDTVLFYFAYLAK